MHRSEQAWIAQEYLAGRTQRQIAEEIGFSPGYVSICIKEFCLRGGADVTWDEYFYGSGRKPVLYEVLMDYHNKGGSIEYPVPHPRRQRPASKPVDREAEIAWQERLKYEEMWYTARYEHAWLMRAEGETYEEIRYRLGVTRERVRQLVMKYGLRVQRAIRRSNIASFPYGYGREYERD